MKNIKIYEPNIETCDYIFRNWCRAEDKFSLDDYDLVYECERPDNYLLDDAFAEFNEYRPEDFVGMSLSVSSVVSVNGELFYCDSFGWVKIN